MVELQGCSEEKCDLFDFMSNFVGLSVLHPGGLKATDKLAEELKLNSRTKVIDIACGKGTTAIYLAQRFGCQVVGIDISKDMIEEAKALAKKKKLDHLVTFQVGDAHALPFPDNKFDIALSQAMLILVEDKTKAIQEAMRVIKPNGTAGWIELSWKKPTTDEFMDEVTNEMCAYCMENVNTFEAWETLFKDAGVKNIVVHKNTMEFNGMKDMISDEGFRNTLSVMYNYITNSKIRARVKKLNNFILSHPEYFSYGIYICKK